MNAFGRLKEADIKITFNLPYLISASEVSANITRETGLATEDTIIELGYVQDVSKPAYDISFSNAMQKYSIVLPLFRGIPTRKPLMDQFTLSGNEWIHFTYLIPGVNLSGMKPLTWRIRVRAIQLFDRIECVSVSDNILDIPRVKESWHSLTDWVKLLPQKIERAFSPRSQVTNVPQQPTTASQPQM